MSTEFTESFDNPQVQREMAEQTLQTDIVNMRDVLEKCDNPVALAEASIQIAEVIEQLNKLQTFVQVRMTNLYFPAPLVEVA